MFFVSCNDKIVLYNEDRDTIVNTLKILPQYQDLEIQETNRPIDNFEFADTPEYIERKAAEEAERIDHLTMTALDLITAFKSLGVTDQMIEDFLNSNLNVKHQLQFCQNVYCGVAKQFCPITIGELTVTTTMIEDLFKNKNGVS